MNIEITEQLKSIVDSSRILADEPMRAHTTFRTGGPADLFIMLKSIKEATETVRLLLAHDIDFTVIGNGSNLLVSDSGYRGCILCMGMDDIKTEGARITAGAGAMLSRIAGTACENSLTGLEFASGIPGSVGGAIVMNAGAYGGEIKDVASSVTLLDIMTGEVLTRSAEEMEFGYRTSIVKQYPYIVLEACFELSAGDKAEIKEKMDDLARRRREKQPLEYPSAGSTFKRPEGYFAGKLIEDAGLKGFSAGGASVSEKHCGFVINKGDATSSDIISVIRTVRSKVAEKFGVTLEPEVVMLGEDMQL
ncbi:MAG: UDP-N-acetylmuramate dehydrogenase [Lachnospiraceae bacterium]|nr:UDP-N-acetylmuramate dehydrogenase [Lachnospiraceae bacterium]